MTRQVIGLEPLVRADDEILVSAYAPALQHYLTGPLPEPTRRSGAAS
ncbi:MAG: hypothetical protein LC799_01625 [Actinobacteria bacterium]|nr:hypothetical protein [Actinomycetota bacterium]